MINKHDAILIGTTNGIQWQVVARGLFRDLNAMKKDYQHRFKVIKSVYAFNAVKYGLVV